MGFLIGIAIFVAMGAIGVLFTRLASIERELQSVRTELDRLSR